MRLVDRYEYNGPRCRLLSQQFAELAKLHKAGDRILSKTSLCLHCDTDECVIKATKKIEV